MKVLKQKLILLLTAAIVVMLAWSVALADDNGPQQSTTGPTPPQAVIERDAGSADDGPQQSKTGPIPPAAVIERDARGGSPPAQGGAQYTVIGVPEYNWRHGCGPTAVGMVVGYYDTHGYDDLIPGDANTQTAAVDQVIASQGNAANPRHYEDYSLPIDSPPTLLVDNSPNYPWGTHADDSVADFMETSWFTRSNYYGWSWSNDICPSFTGYVNLQNSSYNPTCTEYRWSTGALTWAVLTNEIDNGRPMVFLVDSDGDGNTDHFVTIVGYDDGTPHKYGCLDTWASSPGIRWEQFRGMSSTYSWGVWGGWTFQLAGLQPPPTTKWVQLPDETENGIDIRCDQDDGIQRTLADDYECTMTGPITDVTFWGSWKYNEKGQIQKIHLSIHSDDPIGMGGTNPNNTYSMPDRLLWQRDFTPAEFNEILYKQGEYEWWWDPVTGILIQWCDDQIWQYGIVIDDSNQFVQQGDPCDPVIYWLDVYVETDYGYQFGWKTREWPEHWNDDAVWSSNNGNTWNELRYPPGHPYHNHPPDMNSIDLAFAITTGEVDEPIVKWAQMPDETTEGMDIRIDSNDFINRTLADDFECNQPALITDVHFWGSWKDDIKGNISKIHLSIHEDIPEDDPCNPTNWSIPGELLWEKDFFASDFNERLYYTLPDGDYEWFWDTFNDRIKRLGDRNIWQYDIYIDPCEAFLQLGTPEEPIIYWLDIYVETVDDFGEFGWKTSMDNWNDSMVRILLAHPWWLEITYPGDHPRAGQPIGMAFMITGKAVSLPKPAVPHLKWSQPPIEIDPTADTPTYCGWDEESHDAVQPGMPWIRAVADDFRCIGSMPVTSIHWWGSFFDWEWSQHQGQLPAVLPEKWWIGFWNNVPAGVNAIYSYPEMLLHSITIPAARVNFHEVGSDEYYGCYPFDICYQYYVDLDPCEVFWQDDFNEMTSDDIYWISIVAEYNDACEPYYKWGWKSRPWSWMDDAVELDLDFKPNPGFLAHPMNIIPIVDPVWQESFDMAFELDTDPNWIKWEQAYDSIRHWPHYEDEESMAFEDEQAATKYVQYPDLYPTGMDVLAGPLSLDPEGLTVYEKFLADDFLCTASGPITDIHLWASYNEDKVLTDIPRFSLVIYENVPAGTGGIPYSRPGAPLWNAYLQPTVKWVYATAEESFYDPNPDLIIGWDSTVWRFDFEIDPDEAFVQEEGKIYWLGVHHSFDLDGDGFITFMDVMKLVEEWPGGPFGWKTSLDHFEDDAVWTDVLTWGGDPHVVPSGEIWNELRYPSGHEYQGNSIDLAFEITTRTTEPSFSRLVADDWACQTRKPVTAVVWWGSYIGYQYEACSYGPFMPLPVKPDWFLLQIWTDVAAGEDPNPDVPYSHPNDVIWEYKAYDYDEVLVGYDKHPHGEPNEPVFRYSVRLPEEGWFCQKDANDIYWLSVVAVYGPDNPPMLYHWGWTNHEHVFNDDAVEGFLGGPRNGDEWEWYELHDQTGESEDMSFILFTEPDYPECWCYDCFDCGDGNGDCFITFGDLSLIINAWPPGGTYNPCADYNKDGFITFGDISVLINHWPPNGVPPHNPGCIDCGPCTPIP